MTDDEIRALVPDPLPLRSVGMPNEVSLVDGCDCGGLDHHRWDSPGYPRCSIWNVPAETAQASIDAARHRQAVFTGELNRRLHADLAAAGPVSLCH